MLVPFQFKDLDTANPLPPMEETASVFEALPISKVQRAAWQSMDFQPLKPEAEATPSAPSQYAKDEPAQVDTEPTPQLGFEVQKPTPIIDKAKLDALEQEARERGYQAGYSTGHDAGIAEGTQSALAQGEIDRQELLALQQGLRAVEADFFQAIKADLVKLLQIVPRRIIGQELSHNPKAIVTMAESLLSAFASQRSLTLRAHPEDALLLEGCSLTSPSEGESRLTILPDPTLNRADLRLITESGEIDASIESQLARYDKQIETWISGDDDDDSKAEEGSR